MTNIKKEEEYIYSSQPDEPLLQEKYTNPEFYFSTDIRIFKENSREQLTVFLDFFLTK